MGEKFSSVAWEEMVKRGDEEHGNGRVIGLRQGLSVVSTKMAPPKKTVKMDLNSFLNDDTFGSSWAEEEVDLNKITIPIESLKANTIPLEELAAAKNSGMGGGNFRGGSRLDPALGGGRREFSDRVEYPVPDRPPYRAIINNIPWDISPEGVQAWVEDGLQKEGAVEEVDLPRSMKDPTRLKGIAFVSLKEREDLVQTLTFNGTKLNERTVYVSVAAPRREGFRGGDDFDWNGARGSNFQASRDQAGPDLDWGAARGSNYQERRERREEPNLDWGAARGSNYQERRERREEPNLDWSAARGSQYSERPERSERREEPNLDWSAARGSQFQERKPRREEPNLDWGAARGSQFRERKPKRDEPELDWGAARSAQVPERKPRHNVAKKSATETTEDKPKIQKSAFDVLSNDDDEEEEAKTEEDTKAPVEQLAQETGKLTVEDNGEWETVGKN